MKLPPLRSLLVAGLMLALVAGAVLPAGRYQWAARPLRRTVDVLLQPVSHLLALPISAARNTHDPPQHIKELQEANKYVVYYQGLARRYQQENDQLRRENAALQELATYIDTGAFDFLPASVTGRSSGPRENTLRINKGTRDGLAVGLPAVTDANLIGRVVDAGRTGSTVQLITSPGLKFNATVSPPPAQEDRQTEEHNVPRLFTATNDGRLIAIVPEKMPVQEGDLAKLKDADWYHAAQFMVVGQVVAVESAADLPLRKRVIVRPIPTIRYLGHIWVVRPRGGEVTR